MPRATNLITVRNVLATTKRSYNCNWLPTQFQVCVACPEADVLYGQSSGLQMEVDAEIVARLKDNG